MAAVAVQTLGAELGADVPHPHGENDGADLPHRGAALGAALPHHPDACPAILRPLSLFVLSGGLGKPNFANIHESPEILAGKARVNDPRERHEAGLWGKENHGFHKDIAW